MVTKINRESFFMKKIVLLTCMIFCCHMQATLVADLIALKNEFTKTLPAQVQEKIDDISPIMVKQPEHGLVSAASIQFAKGFSKGVAVFALFSIYKGMCCEEKESGCLISNNVDLTRFAILASGAPACIEDVVTHLDVAVSGLKKNSSCPNCVQRASRQDIISAWARIAGSACAMGALYCAALAVDE